MSDRCGFHCVFDAVRSIHTHDVDMQRSLGQEHSICRQASAAA